MAGAMFLICMCLAVYAVSSLPMEKRTKSLRDSMLDQSAVLDDESVVMLKVSSDSEITKPFVRTKREAILVSGCPIGMVRVGRQCVDFETYEREFLDEYEKR